MRCEGYHRRDGGSCGSPASPGSVYCGAHEDGRGRALKAIDEGRDPRKLEAAVVPATTQAALFDEEDLPGDPPEPSYAGEPLR
jgi:hypothetical protein